MLECPLVFRDTDSMSTAVILFSSFWLAIITYVFKFIVANGVHYVNWPKLVPLGYTLPPVGVQGGKIGLKTE